MEHEKFCNAFINELADSERGSGSDLEGVCSKLSLFKTEK